MTQQNLPIVPPPPLNTPPDTPAAIKSLSPKDKTWSILGPVIIDAIALICLTVGYVLHAVSTDFFEKVFLTLTVGNIALRLPGVKNSMPGGGGLISAIVLSFTQLLHRGGS